MTTRLRTSLFVALLWGCCWGTAAGQTSRYNASEEAHQIVKQAIKAMDAGNFTEARNLLDAAEKQAPGWQILAYERAFSYYLQKDYSKAIKLGEKLIEHPDCEVESYQMLGNSYDFAGKRKKAVDVYEAGLKRFPNAGHLYLERGNIELMEKQYSAAREYYEKGIKADPEHASNYFRGAQMYLISDQEIWGMLYGEIFMNMERSSERSGLMSKMLYDTYHSQIKLKGDSGSVSFISNNISISMEQTKKKNAASLMRSLMMLDLSGFGHDYEVMTGLAAHDEKVIDLAALNRIRTRFLDNYYSNKFNEKYPNLLFEYQHQVQEAGHLEAYNYWILRKGDESAFKAWREANGPKWDAFIEWFKLHPMEVTVVSHFHRSQYLPKKSEDKAAEDEGGKKD